MTETVNATTGEITSSNGFDIILGTQRLVKEEKDFNVFYDEETKKYSRKQRYHEFSSVTPETTEEKINLLKLLDNATEMKHAIKKEIKVGGVIFSPYSKLDEDTGNTELGVTTTLLTAKFDQAFVTSSKTFYNKLKGIIVTLGADVMFTSGEEITIIPVKEKGQNHDLTTFVLK